MYLRVGLVPNRARRRHAASSARIRDQYNLLYVKLEHVKQAFDDAW